MGGDEVYDVCLSFAGSERVYAEELAGVLRERGVSVFYDAYETEDMWGRNLYDHLVDVYRNRARFCVLFASAGYARRVWTTFERQAAQDRAIHTAEPYLLPVLFDETEVPGIHRTTACADARSTSPAELAAMLIAKLGRVAEAVAVPSSVVVLVTDEADAELDRVLDTALERCGIGVERERRWSTARRVVAVVPESVASVADVVADLASAIASVHEERGSAATGGKLRIAVHCGQFSGDRRSVDVTGTVDAAASAVVGEVLAAARKGVCAVVVSQRVYDKVVRHGHGGSNPAAFRRVRLPDGVGVHVRVVGYPRPPSGDEAEKTPGPVVTKVTTFNGQVTAGQIGDNYGSGVGDGHR
ncbi:TIR domain-containing protein [Umezawaea sp.]|uniref:TIR domain-containing protein n=1 Tax=Umezawaea sp. TaxID=1955258 RepID=UPI002ED33564